MNLINRKRIMSYIIDLTIILLISFMVTSLIKQPDKSELLTRNNFIIESYFSKDITTKEFINNYSEVSYKIDQNQLPANLINLLISIIYFIIMPLITKGQTLGMNLTKIKIDKPTLKNVILRSLLINGIAHLALSILSVIILKDIWYFIIITSLSLMQLIVIIISLIMVFKTNIGLEDILTNTKIINNKEV